MDSNRNKPKSTCDGVRMLLFYNSELDRCEISERRSNTKLTIISCLLLLIENVGVAYTTTLQCSRKWDQYDSNMFMR